MRVRSCMGRCLIKLLPTCDLPFPSHQVDSVEPLATLGGADYAAARAAAAAEAEAAAAEASGSDKKNKKKKKKKATPQVR